MHNHFDQYLNVKKWILDRQPQHIVECGAANGENTRKILSLLTEYPFHLTVISDNLVVEKVPEVLVTNNEVSFICGISYIELAKMPESSIDLCLIDTDHNYWTLKSELEALDHALSDKGLIIMHDVDSFYFWTGMSEKYNTPFPYPDEEIEAVGCRFGGLGTALIDFLHEHRFRYKLLGWTRESHGAAIVEKGDYSQSVITRERRG